MGWGKGDGDKRWQPHNARGQMITERTTCSHDFIYTVTTLFTQLRLYLLGTIGGQAERRVMNDPLVGRTAPFSGVL